MNREDMTMMKIIDRILALPAYAFVIVAHWLDQRHDRRRHKEARRRQLRAGKETS